MRAKLGIDDEGNLLYESKKVVKKSETKKIVTKAFVKNKSGGHRKIQARGADGYAGVSKREVLKVTNNGEKFRWFNARFTVQAKKVRSFLCLH